MSETAVCPICLEREGPLSGVFTLGCAHRFHTNCILRWVIEAYANSGGELRCPVCRDTIGSGPEPMLNSLDPAGILRFLQEDCVPVFRALRQTYRAQRTAVQQHYQQHCPLRTTDPGLDVLWIGLPNGTSIPERACKEMASICRDVINTDERWREAGRLRLWVAGAVDRDEPGGDVL